MTQRADKPPILRFLVLFAGLLATAIALVLLSSAADPSNAASTADVERGSAVAPPDAKS